jgi:hypothetical protein
MTPTERQRARELADAASPRPWKLGAYRGFGGREEGEHDIRGQDGRELAGVRAMFYRRADAEFTAEARALVPRLLDALEAAERERDEWRRMAYNQARRYGVVRWPLLSADGEAPVVLPHHAERTNADDHQLAEDRADFFASTEDHG